MEQLRRQGTKQVAAVYDRALSGSSIRQKTVDDVHLLTTGTGPPVLFVHGTLSPGLFWLPVLTRLQGVRALVPDRPGQWLSPARDWSVTEVLDLRAAAVAWVEGLLDHLGVESATIAGHSMGGLWGLWFALACPERVERLVMVGTPALPGTRAPLPFRMLATPGIGALIARQPATPKSTRSFATAIGEEGVIDRYPYLIDQQVASGRIIDNHTARAEVRSIVAPWALLSRSGFRRTAMITPAELSTLRVPTVIAWGDRDPVGTLANAREVVATIPDARLLALKGGHVPWLDDPEPLVRELSGPRC